MPERVPLSPALSRSKPEREQSGTTKNREAFATSSGAERGSLPAELWRTCIEDRQALEATQLEQLRALVTELFPANKFYSEKYQAAGVTFDIASLADFSRRFPLTTKAELVADQSQRPPFGTNLTYPLDRYTRYHQTSGTSGTPLRWLDTPESWDWMVENWQRVFLAAGARRGDRVYFAFSFGPFIGFWLAFESASRLGMLCVPGGGLSSAARVRAMIENEVTLLCCTPTYALRLAEVAAQEKLPLSRSKVRRLIVAGEPGGSIPAVRARIEQLWPGAKVFDHHGMTEVGPVTYECPARPGVLHVMETGYYAEVLEPASGRAAEDMPGELVLTTLGRVGSPLLRYRTGDLVRASAVKGARCACGSCELALEGGILGRADDMVIVRGVNVYPTAVEGILRRVEGIAEYRVLIAERTAMTELVVEAEPAAGMARGGELEAAIARDFEVALGLRVTVKIVQNGTLPRPEMKARRWLRVTSPA